MDYTSSKVEMLYHAEIIYKGTTMFIQDLDDQRNSVRVNFVADVTVRTTPDNREIKGRLKNLSIDGISLQSAEEVAAGTACIAEIIVKDRNSKLIIDDVEGEVVRCESGEMAVKFTHPFEWLALFHVYHSKSAQY